MHSVNEHCALPTSYRKVEYVLENLTIKVDGIGASLLGDGIVVRNCTIEVEGSNALLIYGPNAVIENNRIVYKFSDANPGLVTATYPTTPNFPDFHSAIYLRGADNAIVRGNTISVNRGEIAVSVADSMNVRIEGNTFNTDQNPVVLQGTSSASLRENTVKQKLLWVEQSNKLPDQDLK